ncbi:MAG: hypothetical protein KAT34_20110 [Candidatus Aminicenantes bacterium]|jgi:hypothetical protein|nr:hypothetical protein [Candidatus Aminicenantes bacterium]
MSDNIHPGAKKIIHQSIKAFTNLLKEFPKNAAENFIYDGSTLEKIENAGKALTEMATLLHHKNNPFGEAEKNTLKESYKILTLLMDELPKDPADEFLYDRTIHHHVENARETIEQLNHIIL